MLWVVTHNTNDPCRETENHVTCLCRCTKRFLSDPLKYCCDTAKVCQAELSYGRWWNAGWSWWDFNYKGFKHTLPQPLQSPPGNIHTEVKVLFNDLWNSYSEMLQMAQSSSSFLFLNCYRLVKINVNERKLLVWKWTLLLSLKILFFLFPTTAALVPQASSNCGSSLHLYSLSFLGLFFPCALNTRYSWLWCLERWLSWVRR